MWRHNPQTKRMRELVAQGAIGRLRAVQSAFSFRLHDADDVRLSGPLEGGGLADVGCYCVSAARLLAGEPRARVRRGDRGRGERRRRLQRGHALRRRTCWRTSTAGCSRPAAAPGGRRRGGHAAPRRSLDAAGRRARAPAPAARTSRGSPSARADSYRRAVEHVSARSAGGSRHCSGARTRSGRRGRSRRSTAPPRPASRLRSSRESDVHARRRARGALSRLRLHAHRRRPRGRRARPPASRRARRELHRHRRHLRRRPQRGDRRGGAAPVSGRPRHHDEGRPRLGPGRTGSATGGPSTCARRATRACAG